MFLAQAPVFSEFLFFRHLTQTSRNQKFPNHLIENFPANRLLSRHSLDKRESSNQYFLKFFDRFVENFPDNRLNFLPPVGNALRGVP